MDMLKIYQSDNVLLRNFISALGFDSVKVIAETGELDACKAIALQALRVERDFAHTPFSEAGIDASHRWLDCLNA